MGDASSLWPPLVAIGVALATRRAVPALVVGGLVGVWLLPGNDVGEALSVWALEFVWPALSRPGNLRLMTFCALLGAMMGVLSHAFDVSGEARDARTRSSMLSRRRVQLVTVGLGCLVFFDDYANSLLVGTSMRPVADRARVSREKLAFLVDATAAPVTCLAPISSWIAVELSYIGAQLEVIGSDLDAWGVFLRSIGYRFYPWLMIVACVLVALRGIDFGPMRLAESRAILIPRGTEAQRARVHVSGNHAVRRARGGVAALVLPILLTVVVTLVALWWTGAHGARAAGEAISLRTVLAHTSSTTALLIAAVTGCVATFGTVVVTGVLSVRATARHGWSGFRAVLPTCAVLLFAWVLSDLCKELGTATYLASWMTGVLDASWVPLGTFVIAATISFATGTSYGTMAIVFPIAVPLASQLVGGPHAAGFETVLLATVSSVLAGAVWGDHCSPISDTTILSSMATQCDHMEHVRTQFPYAVWVGAIAAVCGLVPLGFGWFGVSGASALCVVVLLLSGEVLRRVPWGGPEVPERLLGNEPR